MWHSDSTANIAKALAAAQGEMKHPARNKENPHFRSKFADLAATSDAARGPLSKHGIAVTQTTSMVDGVMLLTTTLLHESGEWLSSDYPVLPVQQTPQGYGAALTYARRYQFASVVMLASEEDDDGNAASAPNGAPKKAKLEAVPDKPKEPEKKAEAKTSKLTAAELWRRTQAAGFAADEFHEVALHNLSMPVKLIDCTDAHLKRWANWLDALEKKTFSKEEALMLAASNKNQKEATA